MDYQILIKITEKKTLLIYDAAVRLNKLLGKLIKKAVEKKSDSPLKHLITLTIFKSGEKQ